MGIAGTAFRVDRRDVARVGEALVMNGATVRSRRKSGRFVRFFCFGAVVYEFWFRRIRMRRDASGPGTEKWKGADASIETFRRNFAR